MKKRNIVVSLLLCLVPFYGIYWFVSLTNATNKLAPKHATMGGVAAFFVGIITFGIYILYWCYRMGQKSGEMNNSDSQGVLYLLLGMFTFLLVPMCLAQSAMNKAL